MNDVLKVVISEMDASLVALTLMFLVVVLTVVSWHRNKPGFDLSQCIVDSVTQRIVPEKVGYMTVLALMSWGFVALTLQGKMTEWYAGLFAGIFVMGRLGSQALTIKKDIANAGGAAQ